MTEMELRQKLVKTATAYLGCKESDGSHRKIIDIYNSHKPLARNYKVTYTDPWCATFVSAMSIKLGLTDIIPTECSCTRMIELLKAKDAWVENDEHIPSPGDIILYDWQDDGKGDNKSTPDHIGIVEQVSDGIITIIEGNINNAVGRRQLEVNGRYIRGYGVPKYASKATQDGGSDWSAEARAWAVEHGIIRGRGNADGSVDFAWKENITREEMAVMLYRLYELVNK